MYLLKNFYILNPVDVDIESKKKAFDFYKGTLLIKNGKIEKIYRTGEEIKPNEEINEILDGRFNQLIFPDIFFK